MSQDEIAQIIDWPCLPGVSTLRAERHQEIMRYKALGIEYMVAGDWETIAKELGNSDPLRADAYVELQRVLAQYRIAAGTEFSAGKKITGADSSLRSSQ